MRVRKSLTVFVFLIGFFGIDLFGQGTFSVFVGAKKVTTNSYFDVTFTLEGGDGRNFKAPAFNDFKVLSGPSRSMSTTILNGRISRKLSFSYTLQSDRPGKFIIGRASINSEGEVLYTNPVSIEVVKGRSQKSVSEDQQVFVVAVPNTDEVFVGQQLVVDYKLFTTVNVESYNIVKESEYVGFFPTEIRRYDVRTIRQVSNGVTYATKTLKRVALFPQQAGVLTIDPLQVQLGVAMSDPNRPGGFFSRRQIKRYNLRTDTLRINVNLLPESPPRSFSGAVGDFEVASSINRNTLTTDDAISIKMTIRGNGDIKRVQPPKLDFPVDFEVYDPKVINETTSEVNGFLVSEKQIEYLAVPKATGAISIKPAFTYFSLDSNKYVTIGKNVFSLNIRPGSNNKLPEINTLEAEDENIPKELRPLRAVTRLRQPGPVFLGGQLFWVLVVIPFLYLVVVWGYRKWTMQRAGLAPEVIKRRKAKKVAQTRLKLAQQLMKDQKSRSFYDEISKAMLGYVSDKLKIPNSAMTKQNVQDQLQRLNVDVKNIETFVDIIQSTEMALFAGKDSSEQMEEVYRKTTDVITDIEQSLGKD